MKYEADKEMLDCKRNRACGLPVFSHNIEKKKKSLVDSSLLICFIRQLKK